MTRLSFSTLRTVNTWLDKHAGSILWAGVAIAAAANWLQWHRDRRVAQRPKDSELDQVVSADRPRVSILIPAWNEAKHICACLESVLALEYPNKEVVVCAGGADGRRPVRFGAGGAGIFIFCRTLCGGHDRRIEGVIDDG